MPACRTTISKPPPASRPPSCSSRGTTTRCSRARTSPPTRRSRRCGRRTATSCACCRATATRTRSWARTITRTSFHISSNGSKNTGPEGGPMSSQTVGIAFREVMSGGFALGATDPAEGEQKGRAEGSEMTMHASIMIDDVDRFIAEPEHPGGLTGSIDFTPFGAGIAAPTGVFNLFNPTDDPKLKLMVYELGFQHDGKSYYVAGQKN